MSISSEAEKPISPHALQFSQAIGVVFSHSLGMRYVRPFWVDDRATQKVLVGDLSPSPARVVLAVLRPHFQKDIEAANFISERNKEHGRRNASGTEETMIPCGMKLL
ncbi:NBS-LRR type resistance protein [Cucumis melo var. makuwa]|uniref:NBS-LRR type resistance protein n=1 Tax=Cucumis melo var. makuwa TaxID=1194695 RepID=A0A5D3DKI5_CUCMM|nr:NBS-LRR type resistance protein [Cucumis melo var. makuwa]TYK24104.1 NBS-LRR type resistance protein [Cucumis melo var. makuwa]